MSREEVRDVFKKIEKVTRDKSTRVDIYVNSVLLSNSIENSFFDVHYNNDFRGYALNLVVNKYFPVCTIVEDYVKSISFFVYKKEIK